MLDIIRKPKKQNHINPRFRAYGKARIDIAQRAATRDDWDRLWKKSTYPFPFSWGKSWKQCIEYKVADFPAEVGFFIDVLGFPVNAFDPDYAMFTSPDGDFYFSVVPVENKAEVTSPDSIRLQFMVERIMDTAVELERRGVKFDQWPGFASASSSLIIGSFRTPNGISIELWGFEQLEGDLEDQIAIAYLEEDDVEDNELVIPDDEEEEDEPEIDQLQLVSPPSDPISNVDQIEEEPNEGGSIEFDYIWQDES
jgi:catechol 2,3-dioxygenase-like lactoylglutathione lyase family enzyme